MKIIETKEQLEEVLVEDVRYDECILRIYDNKSAILLQTVVVKHPIIFIRGIQEFCKSVNLPVSDISVQLVGYISHCNDLTSLEEVCEISPYVYFKKPDDSDSISKEE